MIRPATNFETQMDGEDRAAIVYRVHQRLLQEVDLSSLEKRSPEEARVAIEASVRSIVADVAGVADMAGLYGDAKEAVIKAVVDEAVGFGPIQPLVDDPTISEVMVNAPGEVYFERDGVIHAAEARFNDEAHILRIVERIIAPLGRRVDESSPYVDARLPDGSRVNVMIPPLIPRSPTITIRKFRPERHTIEDLVQNETFSQEAVEFIGARIEQRKNIVISGGTGTGKTTVLNALSAFIPEAERIITIEDPIELKLQQRHVVAMEARPANIEGRNAVSQRELVRNALRMRPDRIIVGEVRGQEAFDMMQAMNTGHEGSMTTVHANSARDALSRIENMVLMAGLDLPIRAIREQMASALHLLVHLSRSRDGRRTVTSISETAGLEDETVVLRELFKLDAAGRLAPVVDGTPR
ncbi:MAG: CpaF family protein [Chloroflexi bacterium]|nr:CpaF family protein [Chloroflexota bacterium]